MIRRTTRSRTLRRYRDRQAASVPSTVLTFVLLFALHQYFLHGLEAGSLLVMFEETWSDLLLATAGIVMLVLLSCVRTSHVERRWNLASSISALVVLAAVLLLLTRWRPYLDRLDVLRGDVRERLYYVESHGERRIVRGSGDRLGIRLNLGGSEFQGDGVFRYWDRKTGRGPIYVFPATRGFPGSRGPFGGTVRIDEDAREEYWLEVRGLPDRVHETSFELSK